MDEKLGEFSRACDVGIPACGGAVVGAILVAGTRVNSGMPLDEDTGGVVLLCVEHYSDPQTWPLTDPPAQPTPTPDPGPQQAPMSEEG